MSNRLHIQEELRRVWVMPIDWQSVAAESGLRKGKLCVSTAFGWGVQNSHGIDGPSFGAVTPPALVKGKIKLRFEEGRWAFHDP